MEKPTITTTRKEDYDLALNSDERRYVVSYVLNSVEHADGKKLDLDEHVLLAERVTNMYETPSFGIVDSGHVSKGNKVRDFPIREVFRDLSSGQNYTQISQWGNIPGELENIMDKELPVHVKGLLRKTYEDKDVTPYDFGFSE